MRNVATPECWDLKKKKKKKKKTKKINKIRTVVIYIAFCLDVTQGHMNGAPNKN